MVHSAEDGSIPVPDMSALITRLEAAGAGSIELDVAIWDAMGGWSVSHPPAYSSSLDAALALAERVLPDWAWEIRLDRGGASVQTAPAWWMEGLAAPDEGGVSCDGKTPALALCIAILKAKAQGEGG